MHIDAAYDFNPTQARCLIRDTQGNIACDCSWNPDDSKITLEALPQTLEVGIVWFNEYIKELNFWYRQIEDRFNLPRPVSPDEFEQASKRTPVKAEMEADIKGIVIKAEIKGIIVELPVRSKYTFTFSQFGYYIELLKRFADDAV